MVEKEGEMTVGEDHKEFLAAIGAIWFAHKTIVATAREMGDSKGDEGIPAELEMFNKLINAVEICQIAIDKLQIRMVNSADENVRSLFNEMQGAAHSFYEKPDIKDGFAVIARKQILGSMK